MNQTHSGIFEIAPKKCIFDSSVVYEFYSISSKEFLLTVVDIWPFELNLPTPVHFSCFLKCRCSLLSSPVRPLPVYHFHGPNIPGSYAILSFTASNFTFTTRHIRIWVLCPLWLSLLIPSRAISLLFSSTF